MPWALVQQAHCWLCKQASIDFVDQNKDDQRVAQDHEHHNVADHDGHSTNISQQAALVHVDWAACCARFAAHKADGRQAHDKQLQPRTGGRESRVQHVRANDIAQPLRAPRANATTDIARRENFLVGRFILVTIVY